MWMPTTMNKSSGFTLLEVMIAITIFAMLATTVSQVASVTVDNQIHLEKKMLATWIAENKIVEMRLLSWDQIKKGKEDVKMSDREWIITTNVKNKKKFGGLQIPLDMKEVTVSVALKESADAPLQSFVAYIAND